MSERQPKAVANDTVQTTTYRRGELCSPVFICYELTGDRRSPLRVVRNFSMSYYPQIIIYQHTVGTGLAPVRCTLHIKSNSRTTARVVPTD